MSSSMRTIPPLLSCQNDDNAEEAGTVFDVVLHEALVWKLLDKLVRYGYVFCMPATVMMDGGPPPAQSQLRGLWSSSVGIATNANDFMACQMLNMWASMDPMGVRRQAWATALLHGQPPHGCEVGSQDVRHIAAVRSAVRLEAQLDAHQRHQGCRSSGFGGTRPSPWPASPRPRRRPG